MTVSLVGVEGTVVGVCVNPIAVTVSGLGVTLHALTIKKNYPKKVQVCRICLHQISARVEHIEGMSSRKRV